MAGKNEVTLTFAGDNKDLDRALGGVSKGLKDAGRDFDSAADHAEKFADSTESVTKNTRGGKDVLDGFSDSMDALGISLPGPIGNIAGMAGGVADMADGMGTLAAPAIAKMKFAMKGLNATMKANPILTVITVLALLGTAFVVAYKKSETFRNIVHGVLHGLQKAFGVFKKVFMGLADVMIAPYRIAFNAIAGLWNNTIGKLSFSIPGWVPGLGGKGFDVPDIPTFAKGGRYSGGPMIVGERGPELLVPDGGGQVVPNNRLGGAVTVQFMGTSDPIFEAFKKQIRIRGGLQRALG